MNKKLFWLLTLLFLAAGTIAESQQPKVYHVGLLTLGSPGPLLKGLRDGLKEVGYIEGKNLVLDIQAMENYDQIRPIAKAYTEKKVDAIVTFGSTSTLIAKETTQKIPIVFVGANDPIVSGLVKSVARPEANVTGVASAADVELYGKQLEIFKEVVPTLRRAVVLYNARGENPVHAQGLALIQKVAPNLGLKLTEKPVKLVADIEAALSSVSKATTDGLFLPCATLFRDSLKKIAAIAIEKRLPLMGCTADATEKGALLSYRSDGYRTGHRGAWYVDRVLKGTKPQDLPVEAPTHFELVINLKTAKQIGLTIPPNVLERANKVIK